MAESRGLLPGLEWVATLWQLKRERQQAAHEAEEAVLDKAAEITARREQTGDGRLREVFGPFETIRNNSPLVRDEIEVQ